MVKKRMGCTSIEELEKKTRVYRDNTPEATPVSWQRFDKVKLAVFMPDEGDHGFYYDLVENQEGLRADYSSGLEYYVCDPADGSPSEMRANELPREFFNHQLFESGEKSADPTRAFMEEWGLLYSPLRSNWVCLDGWQFLETMSMQGVKETDVLIERMPELAGRVVSKLEADLTLTILQELVLFLRKYIRSDGEDTMSLYLLSGPLTAASCNPLQVNAVRIPTHREEAAELAREQAMQQIEEQISRLPVSQQEAVRESLNGNLTRDLPQSLQELGQLTSAICNQILDTIAIEGVPWRECACDGCDVIFKYAQSPAVEPNLDAYYCCPKHADRQRQRNLRGKPKN